MEPAVTIGLDIAKSVFQVHGVAETGDVVIRQRLSRGKVLQYFAKIPACLVGLEACGAAHYWGRELRKLGHDARLMPPSYVKPYVKRQKNAADAEAICESVTRADDAVRRDQSGEQQSMVLHRVRLTLMRQRIQLSNTIRGHMAEYGLVAPVGRNGLAQLITIIGNRDDVRVPDLARDCLAMLVSQLEMINEQILETDRRVRANARVTEVGRRLMEVPGVGPVLASAMIAAVPEPQSFKSGRNLAAWIGLVPRQNSSGGKERLGGITKQGDRYLRQLLVVGALAVIRYAQRHGTRRPWLVQLLARRTTKIAAVALANKMARMMWAIMTSGERYREPQVTAA